MNKLIKLVCAALAVSALAGCSDAVAKLKTPNDKIITIGNASITRGKLYDVMIENSGAEIAVDRALRKVATIEIETTDEILEKAQSYVDGLKGAYGDRWDSIIAESGSDESQFLETYTESLKIDALNAKYIELNFESVCEKYQPVKAIVLTFTDINEAAYCQRALNTEVLTPEEAAKEYGAGSSAAPQFFTVESTTYDPEARAIINSAQPEDEWAYVANANGDTFYVIHVESRNPEEFKDDVIAQLTIDKTVKDVSTQYWLEKYGFEVYDIKVLNQIKELKDWAMFEAE